MSNKHVKWTAIVIAATGTDEIFQEDSLDLIKELRAAKLTESINIVLCMSTQVKNMKKIYPDYGNDLELHDSDMVTAIYVIEKSWEHEGNDFIFKQEASNFELQRHDTIAEFFRAATETVCKGQRYIMFTWDHGCVYGIFERPIPEGNISHVKDATIDNEQDPGGIIMATKLRTYKHRLREHKALHGNQSKHSQQNVIDPSPQILTVRELCEAIKEGMGGREIEVMIMTNCYMQAFDTGYELVNGVEYLVAPETLIVMTGFYYDKILSTIAGKPAISAKEIAQLAIESYSEKSAAIPNLARKNQALNEVAVSAVDLKHYYSLAVVIDKMAKILTTRLDTENGVSLIKEVREKLIPIKYSMTVMMVDPHYFFNNMGELLGHSEFDMHLKEFNSIYDNAIVHLFAGEYFKPGGRKEHFRPKGFTVYFPLYSNDVNYPLAQFIDDTSNGAGAFALQYSWDNFVISFAKKVGPDPRNTRRNSITADVFCQ